jgi:Uma2 family endonuclease
MAVMQAPRVKHTEPVASSRAAGSTCREHQASAPGRLWDLYKTLDLGRQYRIEFIEGRIVVSDSPYFWHELVITWLGDQLAGICRANGWARSGNSDIELEPGELAIRPDLQIIGNPGKIPRLQSEIPVNHVLLVAEVASRDSKKVDREIKPAGCARAGIPFYLLVDRFVQPLSLTLFSQPSQHGYAETHTVPAGRQGAKLQIPLPFGVTLDATTMPMP